MADWEQALDELVRNRGVAITRYAFLLCGDVREAEDLVQDALVKTFTRRWALRDPESIEGYVRQAVLSTFLDGFRRRQRWAAVRHLVALDEPLAGPEPATTDRMHLEQALTTLSPRERACIVLRFYEDLTVPEVASRLALAPGSVKRYLSDAVHKLELALGPLPSARRDDNDVVPIGRS